SGLKEIAQARGASLAKTVTEIDTTREQKNLSSAIRLFVLGNIRDQKMRALSQATEPPLRAAGDAIGAEDQHNEPYSRRASKWQLKVQCSPMSVWSCS